MLDRHVAAVVAGRRTGQEGVKGSLVAHAVTLHRHVGRGRDARIGVVVDRDGLRAGLRRDVLAVVLTGDGEGPRDHQAAVARRGRGVLVGHRHLDVGVAVVGHIGERGQTVGLGARVRTTVLVGAERHVSRAGDRERRSLLIREVDDLDELAAVAAGVRGRVGPLVASLARTAEVQVGDRRGHGAATIGSGIVTIWGLCVVLVARNIHLVLSRDRRSRGVLNGERGRRAAGVAAVIRGRELHDGVAHSATAVVTRLEHFMAPGHTAASVAGGSATIGALPREVVGDIAHAVALHRQVHGSGVDARCRGVADRDGLRAGGAGGVLTVVLRGDREGPHDGVAAGATGGEDVLVAEGQLEVGVAVVHGREAGVAQGVDGRVRLAQGIGRQVGIGRAGDGHDRVHLIEEVDDLLKGAGVATIVLGLVGPKDGSGAAAAHLLVAQDDDRHVAVAIVGRHDGVLRGLAVLVTGNAVRVG